MGLFRRRKMDGLIKDLSSDKIDKRRKAVLELAKKGEPAVEPLIKALQESYMITFGPHDALSLIGRPAIHPLIKVLDDDSSTVSMLVGASSALSKMADGALKTGDLAMIGTLREKALDPLLRLLQNERCVQLMFTAVCGALGNIGDKRAVEPLEKALEEARKKNATFEISAAEDALKKLKT